MSEKVLSGNARANLRHADLSDIRKAITTKRTVRFIYKGAEVIAEPHLLGRAKRTRAFYLKAFVGDVGWFYFSYAEIRDFEVQRDTFAVRPGLWDSERKIVESDTGVIAR